VKGSEGVVPKPRNALYTTNTNTFGWLYDHDSCTFIRYFGPINLNNLVTQNQAWQKYMKLSNLKSWYVLYATKPLLPKKY